MSFGRSIDARASASICCSLAAAQRPGPLAGAVFEPGEVREHALLVPADAGPVAPHVRAEYEAFSRTLQVP